MGKKPTVAELAAERQKYDGLTEPQAGLLFIAQRSHGSQFAANLARYKRLRAILPQLISEGYWDEEAKQCTPKGLAVVRTVAGAQLAPVREAHERLEAMQLRPHQREAAEAALHQLAGSLDTSDPLTAAFHAGLTGAGKTPRPECRICHKPIAPGQAHRQMSDVHKKCSPRPLR